MTTPAIQRTRHIDIDEPEVSPATSQFSTRTEESEWDIYGDYARESMYGPAKRMSMLASQIPRTPDKEPDLPALIPGAFPTTPQRSRSPDDTNIDVDDQVPVVDGIDRARAALEGRRSSPPSADTHESSGAQADGSEFETPKAPPREGPSTEGFTGRSIALALRERIEQEQGQQSEQLPSLSVSEETLVDEPRSISPKPDIVESGLAVATPPPRPRRSAERERSNPSSVASSADDHDTAERTHEDSVLNEIPPDNNSVPVSEADHTTGSVETASTSHLQTPNETPLRREPGVNARSISPEASDSTHEASSLLASPLPINDEPKRGPVLAAPLTISSPNLSLDERAASPSSPNTLVPHPPAGWSPAPPHSPWTPSSPASPHSIAATRQAVDAVRQTPEGRRPRGLTLVGRMDADLLASKGPVPISFIVGGSPGSSHSHSPGSARSIGLGLPSASRSKSPKPEAVRARSPLTPTTPSVPHIPDDLATIRSSPSKYPAPVRSVTTPTTPTTAEDVSSGARPGFLAARPRSRSFSSSIAKSVFGRKDSGLSVETSAPPVPDVPSPAQLNQSPPILPPVKKMFSRKSSTPNLTIISTESPPPTPDHLSRSSMSTTRTLLNPPDSATVPPSARSASFSFSSRNSKTPRKTSRGLPSPVSNKDYEDTVNAAGTDFELIQPKKTSSAPQSPMSPLSESRMSEAQTIPSAISSNSISSKLLPETDEWGFVKDRSTVPDIYMSRAAPTDHRAVEQKWLNIISTPMPSGGAPKKVKKLATESGIPASLRGKVWAWFMSGATSARQPGLYAELCSHERPSAADQQIDHDVAT